MTVLLLTVVLFLVAACYTYSAEWSYSSRPRTRLDADEPVGQVEPATAPADPKEEAARFKQEGEAAHARKEYELAEELFTQSLELAPDQADLLNQRAWSLLQTGRLDEALADARDVLRLADDATARAQAQHLLGFVHFQRQEYPDAIGHLTEAIQLAPACPFLYLLRSGAHYQLNQFSPALADAAAVIGLGDRGAEAHSRLGWACYSLEQYDSAIDAFTRAIALQPSTENLRIRGVCFALSGKHHEAIADGEAAINLQPHSKLAHMLLSYSYDEIGDKAAAERHSALVGSWE